MSLAVVKDAGGCSIENTVVIDGHLVPMFASTPEETGEKIRGLPNMPIRDDDVILNTYPKAGTHWGFEILTMLLQGSTERTPTQKNQLWLELAKPSDLEQQPSPRILNSHLPLELYPRQIREKRNKMVVIMRNPKDVVVSFYHLMRAKKKYNYNGKFEDFLVNFMDGNVLYGSWFDYTLDIETAAENKDFNMHIVYFEDLKENGVTEIQKIATFLEVNADNELCEMIAEACSFQKMKVEKDHPKEEMARLYHDGFSFFRKEIQKIAKFLEVDADEKLCEEIAEACSFQKMAAEKDYPNEWKGNIYRKGVIGDWKNYFTVAQSEAFDKLIAEKMAASKFKFRCEAL